eukprot:COSAG02_NODE_10375_length_1955_cov_1.974677_1_plen_81_part_00
MVRRAYARRATLSEIARRVGVLIPTSSVGSLSRQVWSTAMPHCLTGHFCSHALRLVYGATRSPLLAWHITRAALLLALST